MTDMTETTDLNHLGLALDAWAITAHQNSVEKGWWDTVRPVDDTLTLILTEMAEAYEFLRVGVHPSHVWSECQTKGLGKSGLVCSLAGLRSPMHGICHECKRVKKPDGIMIEVADAVIRVLDWVGHLRAVDSADADLPLELACRLGRALETRSLGTLTLEMAKAIIGARSSRTPANRSLHLATVCLLAHQYVELYGHSLLSLIELKHAYNVTRSRRHGGKVL